MKTNEIVNNGKRIDVSKLFVVEDLSCELFGVDNLRVSRHTSADHQDKPFLACDLVGRAWNPNKGVDEFSVSACGWADGDKDDTGLRISSIGAAIAKAIGVNDGDETLHAGLGKIGMTALQEAFFAHA